MILLTRQSIYLYFLASEIHQKMLVAGKATSVYEKPFTGWLPLSTMAGDRRTQMMLISNKTMKYEYCSDFALHLSCLGLILEPFYW